MDELRELAHNKVLALIVGKFYTKMKLSQILEISYPTLYRRIEECSWTGEEITIINDL